MDLNKFNKVLLEAELLIEGRPENLLADFKRSLEKFDQDKFLQTQIENLESIWKDMVKERIVDFPPNWKYYVADYYKSSMIKNLLKHDQQKFSKLATKLKHDTNISLGNVIKQLEHYNGIEFSKIQSYDPNTSNDPLRDLEELENEYKDMLVTRDTTVDLPERAEKLIDFGDGFAWYNLNKSSCAKEGDAMGHCGNSGGSYNETIFSLRKKVGDDLYKPFLTFIYNEDEKSLGEMKGRANEKPSKRYHKYIVELLKLDIIEKVKGGGWLAANNFSFNDLDVEFIDEIKKQKGQDFIDSEVVGDILKKGKDYYYLDMSKFKQLECYTGLRVDSEEDLIELYNSDEDRADLQDRYFMVLKDHYGESIKKKLEQDSLTKLSDYYTLDSETRPEYFHDLFIMPMIDVIIDSGFREFKHILEKIFDGVEDPQALDEYMGEVGNIETSDDMLDFLDSENIVASDEVNQVSNNIKTNYDGSIREIEMEIAEAGFSRIDDVLDFIE